MFRGDSLLFPSHLIQLILKPLQFSPAMWGSPNNINSTRLIHSNRRKGNKSCPTPATMSKAPHSRFLTAAHNSSPLKVTLSEKKAGFKLVMIKTKDSASFHKTKIPARANRNSRQATVTFSSLPPILASFNNSPTLKTGPTSVFKEGPRPS